MMSQASPKSSSAARQKAKNRDIVSRVRSMWQRTDSADAMAFLREHSSVRRDRALTIELAYEEYCVRRETGEQFSISSFCDRFPSISRSLYRQIEVHEYVADHPSIVGRTATVQWPRGGDQLFGFAVVEEIGRGAFARAYLCAQPGMGNRQVVVKVSPGGAIEADTMGGLDHPNIMPVYSVQVDDESKVSGICMPFVGRSTLYDLIDVAFGQNDLPKKSAVILEASRSLSRRGDRYHQLTPRIHVRSGSPYVTGALQIVLQLADALVHAHERGVVHGDLKPSNVVMSVAGIPMLVDFNLAQSRESNNFVTGGTLPYMAPEQIRSMLLGTDEEDRVDQRSDVFSLGVILHELLTGSLPFEFSPPETETFAAAGRMLDAQCDGVTSTGQLYRDLDPSLVGLMTRCLAFDPHRRPHDMRVVARELRGYLSWRFRSRRFIRQHRPLVATVMVGMGGLLLAASLWAAARPPLRDRSFQAGAKAYQRQDYVAAIESLNRAIGEDDRFANAYLARGCAAMQQYEIEKFDGWLDSAYQDFTMAGRYHDQPAVVAARAYCSIRMREFDLAAFDLELLHQQGHVTASSANNLAYCYEKLPVSDHQDQKRVKYLLAAAKDHLHVAARLAADLPQPHLNLAILELKLYRDGVPGFVPVDGFEAACRAIEAGEESPVAYLYAAKLAGVLADELGEEERFDTCLDYLEMAIDRGHKLASANGEFLHPFNLVADRPRFQMLVKRAVRPGPRVAATRIIAPDVISSPFSLGDESAP